MYEIFANMKARRSCDGGSYYPCGAAMATSGGILIMLIVSVKSILLFPDAHSHWHKTPDVTYTASSKETRVFTGVLHGNQSSPDFFQQIHFADNSLLIGARNIVYNISLLTLTENRRITWHAGLEDIQMCLLKQRTPLECQNYVKVIARKNREEFLVCGTNAFRPLCRTYKIGQKRYILLDEESGTARCPNDPAHNSTAVYSGKRLFAAAVADLSGRDFLLYSHPLRTEQHDSQWLNDPNFVNSFPHADKVYFFFRETAVENINCGKAVFSRVARVCTNDAGGARVLRNTWTSFSKARLNCSLPGEFPFYFDELQSTTNLGEGNVVPTLLASERVSMLYAVFTTPRNSLRGAAICAFKFSDIVASFEGPFKEQRTALSNWLPVRESEVPDPHPGKSCANESLLLSDQTLNFIKSHPLMDRAVPAFGGQPLLIQTSFNFSFTQIAVDWQIYSADQRYYDIIFVGTDEGKVYKLVNHGRGDRMETIVVEILSVFDSGLPVTRLAVYRDENEENAKLIVVSRDEIRSISVHRCHVRTTCRECVSLRDPYCSWADNKCGSTADGIQSIETGRHAKCPSEVATTIELPAIAVAACALCVNSSQHHEQRISLKFREKSAKLSDEPVPTGTHKREDEFETWTIEEVHLADSHRLMEHPPTTTDVTSYTLLFMLTLLILCILFALLIGFAAGYCFAAHRRLSAVDYRIMRKEHDIFSDDDAKNRSGKRPSSSMTKVVQNQYDLEPHNCSDKCHSQWLRRGGGGKQCNIFANASESNLNSSRTVSSPSSLNNLASSHAETSLRRWPPDAVFL